jgi:hypothetical protein
MPGAAQIHASNFIAELIDNDRLGPTVFDMKWAVLDMKRSKFSVLTSDRPIYMPLPLGKLNAYVMLPLSPTKYFVAARQRKTIEELDAHDRTLLVRTINTAVTQQAREFVWAHDDPNADSLPTFRELPEREIITADQIKAALDAARGATPGDFTEIGSGHGGDWVAIVDSLTKFQSST